MLPSARWFVYIDESDEKRETKERNEEKLNETTERKVNEMKNRKWITALLTFILLMLVTLTGVLAEEEVTQITEQPEPVVTLPAEAAGGPAPEVEVLVPTDELPAFEEELPMMNMAPVLPAAEEIICPAEPVVLAQAPAEEQAENEPAAVPTGKNGNEGLHIEVTETENSYDLMINAGAHKNDAESGRDVDLNLLHFHTGDGFGAGGFVLEAPDGTMHAGMGVHAGMDMEFDVVELEGKARLGDMNNNVFVNNEVDVGNVKAGANFTVGTLDGNVTVGLNGTLETNLVEAKVGGGFTVDGVEVGGHVGGKLGVGVKLNVGYKDGKFKADVGAALGIGIEVGVEIDVGAAATKIKNGAVKAFNWITSWF